MRPVEQRISIAAPPAAVWAIAGDFGAANWISSIDAARMEGDLRYAELDRGRGTVVERLVFHSDAERRFEYELAEEGASMRAFRGRFEVSGEGDSATVLWRGELTAVEAADEERLAAGVEDTYRRSLESLRTLVLDGQGA
ncbi:MAG TPA: SRPBCC family protein [Solirubrobacterales bacterium]|nr:SRPBCC family protein [Solirubrobacterales bacterium]